MIGSLYFVQQKIIDQRNVTSSKGPKVLEVNSSHGLEGIEKVNGADLADKIIDYIEKRLGLSKLDS